MREIDLNGYIDDDMWYGDEITPESLHDTLYDPSADQTEDVHIRLNSYGGSCNAATRMHDDLVAYPGKVFCTISGTAASAATVLAMAADRLEMTPGSLFMIHNPSTVVAGDESDFRDAIELLRVSKESIINIYKQRCPLSRMSISDMMDKTTWMDSQSALINGFIDNVANTAVMNEAGAAVTDCATVSRAEAEKKVQAWRDRHIGGKPLARPAQDDTTADSQPDAQEPAQNVPDEPQNTVDVADNTAAVAPESAADAPEISPTVDDTAEQPETVAAVEMPTVTLNVEVLVHDMTVDNGSQPETAPEMDAPETEEPRIHVATRQNRLNTLKHQLIGGNEK